MPHLMLGSNPVGQATRECAADMIHISLLSASERSSRRIRGCSMRAPALRLYAKHSACQRKLPWTSGRTRGLRSCSLQAAAVGVVGLRQEVRRGAAGAGGRA